MYRLNTKTYISNHLPSGQYQVSRKIDGVRLHVNGGSYLSRAGKPLYNIPSGLTDGIYEVYLGNFKDTISAVRTHSEKYIPPEAIFRLDNLDQRLFIVEMSAQELTDEVVQQLFQSELQNGNEGLMLKNLNTGIIYKVKQRLTFDLRVIDVQEGVGKHKGRMGALITKHGKIGTGFTDEERELFTPDYIVNKLIEVECMEVTPSKKLRMPRFIRIREDKNEEDIL